MQKKILLSVLLLMVCASLLVFFKFSRDLHDAVEVLHQSSFPQLAEGRNKRLESSVSDPITPLALKTTVIADKPEEVVSKAIADQEIVGTVKNEKGEPLAGVLIYSKGEFSPQLSDESGQYRIAFKPNNADLLMHFRLDGYDKFKTSIAPADFSGESTLVRDVVLNEALDTKSTTNLRGRVTNPNGEGVADQQIYLITLGDYTENEVRFFDFASTDENGYFVLDDISINTRYQLQVLAGNGYGKTEVSDILVNNNMPDIDVILSDQSFTSVSGQLIDREGVPLPNVNITVSSISGGDVNAEENNQIELVTDDAGIFQLDRFPEGETMFSLKTPAEIEITGVTLTQINVENIVLPIDVGSHFVSGIVSNSAGEIVQDAIVTMQSTYSIGNINSVSVRSLKTDDSGVFAFENFGPDIRYINVAKSGYISQTVIHEVDASGSQIMIVLDRVE